MPDCCDPKLLQGLVRQTRKDRLVYFILAECRLILPEAQAQQPDHNVHDGARTQGCDPSSCSPEGVSRRLRKRPRTADFSVNRCRCQNSATLIVPISASRLESLDTGH